MATQCMTVGMIVVLVEAAGDGGGAINQNLSAVCAHNAAADTAAAVSPAHRHLHSECYQSSTKCRRTGTSPLQCECSRRGGAMSSPVLVGAVEAVAPADRWPVSGAAARIVVDAVRPACDDHEVEHRQAALLRRPTSQIICRIIQPSSTARPAGPHRTLPPTTGNRKPGVPLCDDRQCHWTSGVTTARTNHTASRSYLTTPASQPRHVDANGNKQQ